MPALYYLNDGIDLVRRVDGNPDRTPDQILWETGWRKLVGAMVLSPDTFPNRTTVSGDVHPAIWDQIRPITIEEAQSRAAQRGLPTEGWEEPEPGPGAVIEDNTSGDIKSVLLSLPARGED